MISETRIQPIKYNRPFVHYILSQVSVGDVEVNDSVDIGIRYVHIPGYCGVFTVIGGSMSPYLRKYASVLSQRLSDKRPFGEAREIIGDLGEFGPAIGAALTRVVFLPPALLLHFHLKDTNHLGAPDELRLCAGAEFSDTGDRWFWEMGAGDVDFIGLWKLLKKYAYKGWIGLETYGTPDPLATMLLSKYYINHVLQPIYN